VHDFLLHRDWLAGYHAALDFFDRHLKTHSHEQWSIADPVNCAIVGRR
jgi:hypothetical protein